ncbi:MAG TPA: GNAT family protein [Micromonosporaceae bacterium]|jgi:RimJ/RimL family protein N-acetyltransferase
MPRRTFPDLRLVTDRLTLRPFDSGDISAVARACADDLTQRWLPLPRPYDEAVAEQWCTAEAELARVNGDGVQLAMADRDTNLLVGGVCLKRTSWPRGITEIGYWTSPDSRGRGFATEAAAALGRWALAIDAIHRVELTAATGNLASQRVAEKAGYRFEGVARAGGYVHGGRVDLRIYSLIRADITDYP